MQEVELTVPSANGRLCCTVQAGVGAGGGEAVEGKPEVPAVLEFKF